MDKPGQTRYIWTRKRAVPREATNDPGHLTSQAIEEALTGYE